MRALLPLIITGPRRKGESAHLGGERVGVLPLVVARTEHLGVADGQVSPWPDTAPLDLIDLQLSTAGDLGHATASHAVSISAECPLPNSDPLAALPCSLRRLPRQPSRSFQLGGATVQRAAFHVPLRNWGI